MENPIKIDDSGGNTPNFGNTHILNLKITVTKGQLA